VQHISNVHSKFALRSHHVYCRHPVSDRCEQARKKERKKEEKPQDENIMSASATQGGHKEERTLN